MEKEVCCACRRPKATLNCEICQEPLCKDCRQFLEASTFSFFKTIPEDLTHTSYCPVCYDATVAPQLETYNEIMERARGLYFFFNTQRKPVALIKRSLERVHVEACADRDETILRLAFFAAEQGFNAVIEAEVTSEKIRNEGYQTSRWQGVGLPAQVDAVKLERHSEQR